MIKKSLFAGNQGLHLTHVDRKKRLKKREKTEEKLRKKYLLNHLKSFLSYILVKRK